MNDRDRGFLEALIDSEGCFSVQSKRPYPVVYIANTNLKFLEKARMIIGTGHIYTQKARQARHKTSYKLEIAQTRLRTLLPELSLVVKENQRLLALEMLSLITRPGEKWVNPNQKRLEDLAMEMHRLNGYALERNGRLVRS